MRFGNHSDHKRIKTQIVEGRVNIENRKASFDYYFVWSMTAGIELLGSEVKQIRNGKVSLVDCFCYFSGAELFLKGMNVAVAANLFQHNPIRDRKLLVKKTELLKLEKEVESGLTIVVRRLFSQKGFIKVEIAVAKGKKERDKREVMKKKDSDRELKQIKP